MHEAEGAGSPTDAAGAGHAAAPSAPPASGAAPGPSQGAPAERPCPEAGPRRLAARAEPPTGEVRDWGHESRPPAWRPGPGACDAAAAAPEVAARAFSPPPSAFTSAAPEGQGAAQAPRAAPVAGQPAVSPRAESQLLTGRGPGLVAGASWHHSHVLWGSSGLRQKTDHLPGGPALSSQHSGVAARPPRLGEDAPTGPQAARLPNQVSVITKQPRPEPAPGARAGPVRPPGGQPASAPASAERGPGQPLSLAQRGGETEAPAQRAVEGAAVTRTSPEVSTSCRRLEFGSPSSSSRSSSPEDAHGSPAGELSRSADDEPARTVGTAPRKQGLALRAARPDSPGAGAERPLSAVAATAPGGSPAEGRPSADLGGPGGVAVSAAATSPGPQPRPREAPATPEAPGAAEPAWASAAPQSRLPGPASSYTGIREPAGGDTEVEESEAPSCSEGENDADALPGEGRPGAPRPPAAESGAGDAGTAEPGPGCELGALTSALRDWDISTLSEADGLSTSEVVSFLESCQLRDYSSADSVSECSSKGALRRERPKELKQSEAPGEPHRKQLWEEEAAEASEDWLESEEDDGLFRKPGQLAQCSLETLARVLAQIGQGLQATHESHSILLNSVAADLANERGPPRGTAGASDASEPAPQAARSDPEGGAPASDRSDSRSTESSPGPTAGGEEAAFQCQVSTVTSEVKNVPVRTDQNLVVEKGDNGAAPNGVTLVPSVDPAALCDTPGDAPASPGQEGPDTKSPEPGPAGPTPGTGGDGNPSCVHREVCGSGQSPSFDKSRLRNRPVRPSVRISAQIFDQNLESPTAASDHTYYNSKLEPCGKSKSRSKGSNRDQSGRAAKASAAGRPDAQSEAPESSPGERTQAEAQRSQAQPGPAAADTSEGAADTLSKIRQEVGPPLPPLLAPLVATPPRTRRPASPLTSGSGPASPAGPLSPWRDAPAPPGPAPLPEAPGHPSPPPPSPSPSSASAGERVLSSPLQFCAATPKHALPVPGRLPPLAPAHAAAAAPPENSVKILDTMYPELSARARTLNILKGNIQLTRGAPADAQSLPGPAGALAGFKAITSTSTAFVKAGGSCGGDGSQDKAHNPGTAPRDSGGKRGLLPSAPRSAKRLRLDSPPEPDAGGAPEDPRRKPPRAGAATPEAESGPAPAGRPAPRLPLSPRGAAEPQDLAIAGALRRIAESPFDLLPVIRSHIYVGNISRKPVMRDQEKDVVYEFSTTRKHLADPLLRSILAELKAPRASAEPGYTHALCRVYVGLCRQLGDLERARLLCYGLLKEGVPESEKLTLFIANMWQDVFDSQSVVNTAMQLVARRRADGEVLNCLRAFLSWEKNAPADVGFMVSKLLLTIQLCPNTEFQPSDRFGEDLSSATWECIFAIDLLCCHQKWVWTHDNIVSKELWPIMDKWIKYRKGHANVARTPDVIVASVLRLIGRLGQLGLKEGFPSAVKNISSVIGTFIQHARDEDIPWGVQLAAAYALCDLSPSSPAEAAAVLEAWCEAAPRSVPPAVLGGLREVHALCAEDLG